MKQGNCDLLVTVLDIFKLWLHFFFFFFKTNMLLQETERRTKTKQKRETAYSLRLISPSRKNTRTRVSTFPGRAVSSSPSRRAVVFGSGNTGSRGGSERDKKDDALVFLFPGSTDSTTPLSKHQPSTPTASTSPSSHNPFRSTTVGSIPQFLRPSSPASSSSAEPRRCSAKFVPLYFKTKCDERLQQFQRLEEA